MALDWVVGFWHGSTPTTVMVGNQVIFQLLNSADLDEHEDQVVVERVVGQYRYRFTHEEPTEAGLVHTRLTVRPENTATGAVFNAPIAPQAMVEEKFMWHKVHFFSYDATAGSARVDNMFSERTSMFQHPEWNHVDCRVKRRVEELDRLCWVVEPVQPAAGVGGSLEIWLWLRVLVRS